MIIGIRLHLQVEFAILNLMTMKKLLNYFLLLGMSILLGACSSDEDDIAPVNNDVLKKFAILKNLNQEANGSKF